MANSNLFALTITQPWLYPILAGAKNVENRDWYTSKRGLIALHAGSRLSLDQYYNGVESIAEIDASQASIIPQYNDLALGKIVGVVELFDCVEYKAKYQDLEPWFFGPYGFFLRNPVKLLTPLPCKGALGFWKVSNDLVSEIKLDLYKQNIRFEL